MGKAMLAQEDQRKRTIEVDTEELVKILTKNRAKHIAEYEEAMAGYKSVLKEKIAKACDESMEKLRKQQEKLLDRVDNMSDADIENQRDYLTLVREIGIEMKVPRCYAKEYDAAIDMAVWDVRETLELTSTEFNCFVRDQWDWTSNFAVVSGIYKASTNANPF